MDDETGWQAEAMEAVVFTNRNFRITNWSRSAEKMYGWRAKEVIGKNINDLLSTQFIGKSVSEVYSGLATAGRLETEVKQTSRSGSLLSMVDTITLLRDATGEITGMLHILQQTAQAQAQGCGPGRDSSAHSCDESEVQASLGGEAGPDAASGADTELQQKISELERQVMDLTDKNSMMTDFFTNISHEFKTPLSIILVDLQLMEYRLRTAGGEMKDVLGKTIVVMRQNALRLLRLVGNLLDVTKVEAGFMKTRLVSLDVVELARGLTEAVRNYAGNLGIEISFTSACHVRNMPMDGEKLERIMLNLLSNSIKHTPVGGHICVSLRNAHDHVTISVKDDGEGIPDDKKEFIFDRFRQVNTSLTRASEGSGIGLALTRALVELLQGKIWFNSKPGAGCEFFVELPVLKVEWQAASPELEGISRDRKVEMEFSDIPKLER